MPIAVVCPGCKAQFRVSEKFAGKKGPCPKCKFVITIPAAAPEVKIHEPEQYASGGKDVTGKLITKPIPRSKLRVQPGLLVAVGGGALVILVAAWLARDTIKALPLVQQNVLWTAAMLALSPPLVVVGYRFLKSDEDLQPYRGWRLWLRAAICALVYVALWSGFAWVPSDLLTEYWNQFLIAAPFLIAGAVAALACLDLDFGSGFFHCCFYVAATIAVRYAAGLPPAWGPPA